MSQTIISTVQKASDQSIVSRRQETSENLLRDLAFVLHATRLVKQAMTASAPAVCIACAA